MQFSIFAFTSHKDSPLGFGRIGGIIGCEGRCCRMKSVNIVFLLFGVVMLVESLTLTKFLNRSEVGDAEDEGFAPRWYHQLAFAAFSIAIIVWNAVKLYQ